MPLMGISERQSVQGYRGELRYGRWSRSIVVPLHKRIRTLKFVLLVVAILSSLPVQARSQALSSMDGSPDSTGRTTAGLRDLTYVPPTQRTKVNNYVFDAFGPYPIAGAAIAAGINQWTNAATRVEPRDQGLQQDDLGPTLESPLSALQRVTGWRKRSGKIPCTTAANATGVLPRLRHAAISTLTGRQGEDGHRVFSVPALAAPYAGSMTAVYGWYPNRFGVKDAFPDGQLQFAFGTRRQHWAGVLL